MAVAESLGRGGGELIHVSMAGVAAIYAALPTVAPATEHPAPPPQAPPRIRPGGRTWRRQRRRAPPGLRKALLVMLIQRATLLDGRMADIRVGAQIDEVGDGLVARRGEGVLYAGGGTVLPGLHDHHVHLRSAASALDSFFVGPPGVTTKAQLTQLLSNATPGPDGWIRAVGYHESVAGELDRTALDAVVRDIPVRIQHRSGALWILNSAALGRVGLAEHPDGRLRSADRRLVGRAAAARNRPGRTQPPNHRDRRHRRHRRHPRPRRRRHGLAVGGAPSRRVSATAAFPVTGQENPAR